MIQYFRRNLQLMAEAAFLHRLCKAHQNSDLEEALSNHYPVRDNDYQLDYIIHPEGRYFRIIGNSGIDDVWYNISDGSQATHSRYDSWHRYEQATGVSPDAQYGDGWDIFFNHNNRDPYSDYYHNLP